MPSEATKKQQSKKDTSDKGNWGTGEQPRTDQSERQEEQAERGRRTSETTGQTPSGSEQGGTSQDRQNKETGHQSEGEGESRGEQSRRAQATHAGADSQGGGRNPGLGPRSGQQGPGEQLGGPGPHGSYDPETAARNKNKPLTSDWGKGDKH